MRHRFVIAAALLLALAGCSDDSPEPKASATTTPATASPSGPVAPVLPTAAKENTSVGAKAFVRYWFDAVSYGMQTGDVDPMTAASATSCKTCTNIREGIEASYASGGHLVGRGWSIEAIRSIDDRPDGKHVYVFVTQGEQHFVDKTGATVSTKPEKKFGAELFVPWDKEFRVRELALL